jgi:hypothetical protein
MPIAVAEPLRLQAEECLRISRASQDPAVKNELLAAAIWLHEKAAHLEKLAARRREPDKDG